MEDLTRRIKIRTFQERELYLHFNLAVLCKNKLLEIVRVQQSMWDSGKIIQLKSLVQSEEETMTLPVIGGSDRGLETLHRKKKKTL